LEGEIMGKTLFEKIWDAHVVRQLPDGTALLYIDRHLVHEVTSPQAFDGHAACRPQGAPSGAGLCHHGPQRPHHRRRLNIEDPISRAQVEALQANCETFGIRLFGLGDSRQGIVHVIGPEWASRCRG
jgi:3-isopropylmalate/(R)-2-methylmalate dehydratase large subunit